MKKKSKIKLSLDRAWDTAFKTIPKWDFEKIAAAKVLVVGAGALGNEVVKNLTLLNIGNIVIVDFDVVEYSNLSKSILFKKEDTGAKKAWAMAKNVRAINDSVKVLPLVGDISTDVGLGVFRRMDVVIGCLDNRLARLFINQHCFKVNKIWIDGALDNLAGQFNVYAPGKACYECSLTDEAKDIINFRLGCPDIAKRNASMGLIATTPISSSIIGAFQVQEALKVIFGNEENSMVGQGFQYDGENNFFLQYRSVNPREECDSHVHYESIIEATGLSHNNTVSEVLDWLEAHFREPKLRIKLNQDIVLKAYGPLSDQSCRTAIIKNHLMEAEEVIQMNTQPGEALQITEFTNIIDRNFPFPERSLKQIGIPFLDVLTVETKEDIYFVELSGDEELLSFS